MFNHKSSNQYAIDEALERAATYRAMGLDSTAEIAESTAHALSVVEALKNKMLADHKEKRAEEEEMFSNMVRGMKGGK